MTRGLLAFVSSGFSAVTSAALLLPFPHISNANSSRSRPAGIRPTRPVHAETAGSIDAECQKALCSYSR